MLGLTARILLRERILLDALLRPEDAGCDLAPDTLCARGLGCSGASSIRGLSSGET